MKNSIAKRIGADIHDGVRNSDQDFENEIMQTLQRASH